MNQFIIFACLSIALVCVQAQAQLKLPNQYTFGTGIPFDERTAADGAPSFQEAFVNIEKTRFRFDTFYFSFVSILLAEARTDDSSVCDIYGLYYGGNVTDCSISQLPCETIFSGFDGKNFVDAGMKQLPDGRMANAIAATINEYEMFYFYNPKDAKDWWAIGSSYNKTLDIYPITSAHSPGPNIDEWYHGVDKSQCKPATGKSDRRALRALNSPLLRALKRDPPVNKCPSNMAPCCLYSADNFHVSRTFTGVNGAKCPAQFFDPFCSVKCVDTFQCKDENFRIC